MCEKAAGTPWHHWVLHLWEAAPDSSGTDSYWLLSGSGPLLLLWLSFGSRCMIHMGGEGKYTLRSVQVWQLGGCSSHLIQFNKYTCTYSVPDGQGAQ